METFHEVLPDNLVFFHFHYIGTKEIKPMDYTIVLYVKNCISEENYTSGVQTLPQTFRDQAVQLSILDDSWNWVLVIDRFFFPSNYPSW